MWSSVVAAHPPKWLIYCVPLMMLFFSARLQRDYSSLAWSFRLSVNWGRENLNQFLKHKPAHLRTEATEVHIKRNSLLLSALLPHFCHTMTHGHGWLDNCVRISTSMQLPTRQKTETVLKSNSTAWTLRLNNERQETWCRMQIYLALISS